MKDPKALSESEKTRLVKTEDGLFVCTDADYKKELEYLKAKVDAGANMIITQMVFDSEVYEAFLKDCRAIGIKVPVFPGIMCVQAYGGFKRMTAFCKSRYPASLDAKLDAVKDDADKVREVGIQFGAELCRGLLKAGAPGLHFYTLNLSKVTTGILEELDMLPKRKSEPRVAVL